MIITVEILDSHALKLLQELEALKIVRLLPQKLKQTDKESAQKVFTAIRIDTRGFKFNREEANER